MHDMSLPSLRRYILYYSLFPLFLLDNNRPCRLYPIYHVSPLSVSFLHLHPGTLYIIPVYYTSLIHIAHTSIHILRRVIRNTEPNQD
jgi:hypothetical protein